MSLVTLGLEGVSFRLVVFLHQTVGPQVRVRAPCLTCALEQCAGCSTFFLGSVRGPAAKVKPRKLWAPNWLFVITHTHTHTTGQNEPYSSIQCQSKVWGNTVYPQWSCCKGVGAEQGEELKPIIQSVRLSSLSQKCISRSRKKLTVIKTTATNNIHCSLCKCILGGMQSIWDGFSNFTLYSQAGLSCHFIIGQLQVLAASAAPQGTCVPMVT